MKIGDKFIALHFETNDDIDFIEDMIPYVNLECELIDIDDSDVLCLYNVKFEDKETWWWDKNALKPINNL